MASDSKPAIYFVHGAFHKTEHGEPLLKLARSHGYTTYGNNLPTSKGLATTDAYEDADFVRGELRKLIEEEGREVVVVLHSYAGFVGTMACHESFAKGFRQSKGLSGGILGILYIAAVVVPEGQAVGTPGEGMFHPAIKVEDDLAYMTTPGPIFYNDLPEAEQEYWASKLNRQSVVSFVKPLNYVGYKYHPSTYLFCTNDMALPFEVQKKLVDGCGVEMQHEFCDSDHSPFISQPKKVLDIIEQIVGHRK